MFWAFIMNAQNQLPLANANLEEIEPNTNNFTYWSNLQTNGGQVNYSIETENLIPGSSRAQKSEIISIYGHVLLGTKLNNEHYFMDADFNVVIKASIDEIYENPRIVEDAYIKAGQDLDKTKTISAMFKSL